jgi:mannitol/fructose-specific phosphotransferase system IIA component (Ntr-type)
MRTARPPISVHDLLTEGAIIAELRAGDRDAALAEMAEAAARCDGRLDGEGLLEKLLERERLGSTAIGEGVAIPHGKLAGLAAPLLVLALSRRGVEFAAPDGKPCRVFFLAVSSADAPAQNLSLLAAVSRVVRGSRDFLPRLVAARTAPEILDVIRRAEEPPA